MEGPLPPVRREWTDYVPCLLAVLCFVGLFLLVGTRGEPVYNEKRLLTFIPIFMAALFPFALLQTRITAPVLFAWTLLIGLASFYAFSGPDFLYHYLQSNRVLVDAGGEDKPALNGFLQRRLKYWAWLVLPATALIVFTRRSDKLWARAWLPAMLTVGLFAGILWCVWVFWNQTSGSPVYQDDHTAFMQRLMVFAKTFPQVLYYDPFWEGGGAKSYLASSGTAAPGLLAWPLWRFFPMHEVYTPGLIWLYLFVVPACLMGAVRLFGGGTVAMCVAGLLALGATRSSFLWQLHFGTLGFSVAMPFLLLAIGCLYRILYRRETNWWLGVLLLFSGYIYLSWPAGVNFALVPMALVVLGGWRGLRGRGLAMLVVCTVVLALLLLPYVFAIINHSKIANLADAVRVETSVLGILFEELMRAHPVALIFGLVGCMGLRDESGRRRCVCLAVLGLFVTMTVGSVLWPHLELVRASVPLFLMASIPAALLIERWCRSRNVLLAGPAAAALGLMVLGVMTCADFYDNRNLEHYIGPDLVHEFAPVNNTYFAYLDDFAGWAKDAPRDGRIAFLGRTGEKYGRAHSAYLPVWTGRPMLSGDYYAFPPELYDLKIPPEPYFENGIQGWMSYLHLFNVAYVVTFNQKHDLLLKNPQGHVLDPLHICRLFPQHFTPVFEFGAIRKFYVFEVRNHNPTWFLENTGSVEADINRLRVRLDDPDNPAQLRFQWAEGLRASGKATLEPVPIYVTFPGEKRTKPYTFIRVIPNGESDIDITYRKLF